MSDKPRRRVGTGKIDYAIKKMDGQEKRNQ
jgi:hypothetical protein